jgi:L-ectoine synthase
MGFTVCHTVVRAGSESRLHYIRHFEACYCIAGAGEVEDMSGTVHRIEPGTIYVLDEHDEHFLRADAANDMVLVSVFNPPLKGTERHVLGQDGGSAY